MAETAQNEPSTMAALVVLLCFLLAGLGVLVGLVAGLIQFKI